MRRFPGGKHAPGGLSQLRVRAGLRGARPPASFRVITAAVFAVGLVAVAVAVGVGAMPMPLTTAQVSKTTDAVALAPSRPSQLTLAQSSAEMATFAPHIAVGTTKPSPSAKKASTTPKASATPTESPSTASATPSPTAPTSPTEAPSPSGTAASGLTPAALPGNVTPKGSNQLAWSEAILAALGAPDTDANIISMGYWMQNEAGGLVGENNPINVSEQGYNGWNIQSEGSGWYLRSYPTVADGVAAIAAYLSYPNYSEIKGDLQAGIGLGSSSSTLASQLSVYSGGGYTTIPDSWGSSQGQPET